MRWNFEGVNLCESQVGMLASLTAALCIGSSKQMQHDSSASNRQHEAFWDCLNMKHGASLRTQHALQTLEAAVFKFVV